MEWIETTGKTLEEAQRTALEQLGVAMDEAEFEVLSEPRAGLFGRSRGQARVRARVRPRPPRPKEDRRDRRRRPGSSADGKRRGAGRERAGQRDNGQVQEGASVMSASGEEGSDGPELGIEVPLAQQAEVAERFLTGVLDRFGLPATLEVRELDADTVELAIQGGDLGLLIGPRGTTVEALQDLTRTVVQRRTGARRGRILVDVAGYRQRRRQALERFVRSVAEQVLREGREQVLEPMGPPDRKVVHDTINTIPGVTTRSRGEEPQRRVVIVPQRDES